VYTPSKLRKRTCVAPARTPASSSTSRSFTPRHFTSSTRQPVTHWKSFVIAVWGRRSRTSAIFKVDGRST
jgi:hypothetical protein